MSWVHKLVGWSTNNGAEVDANNRLLVNLPTTLAHAGFGALAGRSEHVSGVARVNPAYVTEGRRLAIAPLTLLWDDTFNATALNTAKYRAPATTQTVTLAGGYVNLNASSIVTINTNCAVQTWRTFPLFANSELRVTVAGMFTTAPQANATFEWGLFAATLPGAAIPSDGVFFRINAAGELRGVLNYNGTETQTAGITVPDPNVNHDWSIVVQTNVVVFRIDDVVVATLALLTDAPALGQPMMAASVPFTARHYIGASAPALATQFKISDVHVTALGMDTNRSWETAKAAMGHSGHQGQNGHTMGSTANYANSANPAAVVPTNTTAALGNGLGGQFWSTQTLALNTDGIISSYQNPAGTVNITGRTLLVYGVWIDATVQTTITGGPYVLCMSLAFGHTTVTLAGSESATLKIPRRVPLGKAPVVVNQAASTKVSGFPMHYAFRAPIIVNPGEFIQVVEKKEGSSVSAGVIAYQITFDSVFE